MDKIKIQNLEVYCNHGVFPEETKLGQKFLISAVLYMDTREAGLTDRLELSVNYGEVSHFMKEYMENHTFKLIEAVVENLAREILLHFSLISKVTLEIKKPWAPIGLPLDTVSIEITRGWHRAYIALGSNMGEKEEYLKQAVQALTNLESCSVEKVSDFIVTEPYGVTDQDPFLNGALELKTLLTPFELLDALHQIEKEAGRKRVLRWGPRTLDLDILFYDDLILDTVDLQIPHVGIPLRDFVLLPMAQIAPYLRHPVLGKTIGTLKDELLKED
jgi:dihydroneopterin aldolase/2-amino-4-hydroxy-6-hydroxymethyldihydropteridine diphosphokinase